MPSQIHSMPTPYLPLGSPYTSTTSVCTLSADTDALHRLLASREVTVQVIAGAFEEFAWRGVLRGTRVRDWCEGLRTLLDELHIVQDLYTALQTPSIITLFPFLSLITVPTEVQAHFFYTPASLSASQFANLDRDTLVDALLSLIDGNHIFSEEDLVAPVTELVLEHIGTVWRRLVVDDVSQSGMADGIAKALAELEFELQCQGTASSLRTLILPIVRRIRFDLGFVTSFQLVSRLKSHIEHANIKASYDPHHIIKAWAIRRLNCGCAPQKVHDDLIFIRERVRDDGIQAVFEVILSQLGLENRDEAEVPVDTMEQYSFGKLPPTPTRTSSSTSIPKISTPPSTKKVLSSLFASNKKANRKSFIPPKTKSPLLGLPAGFDPARRPSLPSVFSPNQPFFQFSPGPSPIPSPLKSSSLTSFQSVTSTDSIPALSPSVSSTPSLASDLLSQILTMSDTADVRLILLDYIVETRYRLHLGGGANWYFGTGRETAASTLDMLEGRLVGKRDVMDLAAVFGDIRKRFDIPLPGSPIRLGTRAAVDRDRQEQRMGDDARSELSLAAFLDDGSGASKDLSVYEPHSRNVSYEIDSYYHRRIEEEDDGGDETFKVKRKSTGANSEFSLSSCYSTRVHPDDDRLELGAGIGEGAAGQRSSVFSNYTYTFSIREAKVGHSEEAVTVQPSPTRLKLDESVEIIHAAPDSAKAESHTSTPTPTSPYRTFFPSRSESALAPSADSHSSSSHSSHTHRGKGHRLSLSPTGGHTSLGIPRSVRSHRSGTSRASSPDGSFHSLISALDLETRHPIDYDGFNLSLLRLFPDPNTTILTPISTTHKPPSLSLGLDANPNPNPYSSYDSEPSTPIDAHARKLRQKQNRQFVVVDLELSPERQYADELSLSSPRFESATADYSFPSTRSSPATPGLDPFSPSFTTPPTASAGPRRRYTSDHTRSLDPIDELAPTKRTDLPLAQLLALFTSPMSADGSSGMGTRAGMRPEDVKRAVEGFVLGEMGYADELGSGWDGEDQRRVVWLLRQIAAMIPDPDLQYPIHQQILHLARHPPTPSPSNRTSRSSTSSTSTTGSNNARYPYTPATTTTTPSHRTQLYPRTAMPTLSTSTSTSALYTSPSPVSRGFGLGVSFGSTPDLTGGAEGRSPRTAGLAVGMGKKGDRSSMMSTFGVGLGLDQGEREEVKGYDLQARPGLGGHSAYH